MAAMPKVIRKIVMSESAIIQAGTWSRRLLQKHEQFAEQEQRYENQPELAPQQSAQRNRRALQNPESFSFQADRRKGKADGDGAEDETG